MFGLIATTLLIGLGLMDLPKAHAADSSWNNIENAKKAIENVAPVISESPVDKTSASYVFSSDEFIQKPLIAETQITVEPPKPKVVKAAVQKTTVAKKVETPKVATSTVGTSSALTSDDAHSFPYGYCTFYVASRRFIPWSGNAIAWLAGAKAYGFATGNTPQVGAIVVTSEGGRAGHVAMIDGVNGSEITLTEMNYHGYGVISSRTISASYGRIMGYIY